MATCDFGGSAHLISIPSNVSYATVDSIASADIAHATWNTLMASGGFILGGIVGVGLTVLLLTMHRKNAARKMYYGRNPSDVVLMGDRANGEERTPLVSKF